MGRRVGDSFWEDPDETPRKSLVLLFDGSGGSTPQTRSSDEDPNTDDEKFIKDDGESESDPPYMPTDESEWWSGTEDPDKETKKDKPTIGDAWIDDTDGEAVWVPEEIGGGGPGGDHSPLPFKKSRHVTLHRISLPIRKEPLVHVTS